MEGVVNFGYRQFGKKKDKYLIELTPYKILLKIVTTKKKELQFHITISDDVGNSIIIRGYPSRKPPPVNLRSVTCKGQKSDDSDELDNISYQERRSKISGNSSGLWRIEDIIKKGYSVEENRGKKFSNLMDLFCTVTPQDANELGPVLEDFIREKYFNIPEWKVKDYTGSLGTESNLDTASTTSQKSYLDTDSQQTKLPTSVGSIGGSSGTHSSMPGLDYSYTEDLYAEDPYYLQDSYMPSYDSTTDEILDLEKRLENLRKYDNSSIPSPAPSSPYIPPNKPSSLSRLTNSPSVAKRWGLKPKNSNISTGPKKSLNTSIYPNVRPPVPPRPVRKVVPNGLPKSSREELGKLGIEQGYPAPNRNECKECGLSGGRFNPELGFCECGRSFGSRNFGKRRSKKRKSKKRKSKKRKSKKRKSKKRKSKKRNTGILVLGLN